MSKFKNSSNKLLYQAMGKRLRNIRLLHDYTQEQMDDLLEIGTAYYGKVERGNHGLSLEKLFLLNEKLDIDINYLLTGKSCSQITIEEAIKQCPKEKRYDLEQLIKYALNLSREVHYEK